MNSKNSQRPRAPRAIRPSVPIVPMVDQPSIITNVPSTPTPNSIEETVTEQTPAKTPNLRVKWDHEDDQTMIDVLTADRQPANAAIGPENATSAQGWKRPTWVKVVNALAGSEIKMVNGVRQVSNVKSVEACKSHWYVLCGLYDSYKHLNGLSGAGWENGCITLPDPVWEPILADPESKKSRALLQCRGRPFPIFQSIAPLLEGHKATGKYVASAIVNEPAEQAPATPSTGVVVKDDEEPYNLPSPLPSPFASPRSSPPPSDRFGPPAASNAMDDSSCDEGTAKKRHRTSKAALAALAPIKKKKRSGVEIMDNLSSTMQDFGSTIESSINSASANIDNAARLLAEPASSHAQAVKLVYASDHLTRPQRYAAVDLFGEKPLMAETYLNTPAADRDDWLEYILDKPKEVSTV